MIIGLTGPSGSKKTVAAKRLQKNWGFTRIHVGDPIKKAVRDGFGLKKKQVMNVGKDTPAPQLGGATPRSVMEAYGVGIHTAAPKATAIKLHKKLMKAISRGKSVAVDGVRSPHEAALIKSMGGTIWRMDNNKGADVNLPMDKRAELVKADSLVDSSKSKEDIQANVDSQMMKMMAAYPQTA